MAIEWYEVEEQTRHGHWFLSGTPRYEQRGAAKEHARARLADEDAPAAVRVVKVTKRTVWARQGDEADGADGG